MGRRVCWVALLLPRLAAMLAREGLTGAVALALAVAVAMAAVFALAVAEAVGARRCRYVDGCTKGSS